MKIWFDCTTAKHALLFSAIADHIEEEMSYEYLFTCRDHEVAPSVLDHEGRDYKVIGEYGGGTLEGKLLSSVERATELARYIVELEEKPDFAMYFTSPEAARVAFGLAIPAFCLNDTPHAKAMITLVIPFSDHVLLPKFIPRDPYRQLVPQKNIIQYNGIDAIDLFKEFTPDRDVVQRLGLNPSKKIILFRPEEAYASFYKSEKNPLPRGEALFRMVKQKIHAQWVVLPRYKEHRDFFTSFDETVVPTGAIDTRSLEKFADIVVNGGSTIAVEAAVQGTPAVSYFPEDLYRWKWMKKKGFPVYNARNIYDAAERILDILDDPSKHKVDTSNIINTLEAPSDVIIDILKNKQNKDE